MDDQIPLVPVLHGQNRRNEKQNIEVLAGYYKITAVWLAHSEKNFHLNIFKKIFSSKKSSKAAKNTSI